MARNTKQDEHEGQPTEGQPTEGQPTEGQPTEGAATLDDIDGAFILAAPLATVAQPKNKRNELQEKMDKKVLEVHELWVKAGRPSVWGKQVESGCVVTYFLAPEHVSAREKLVNKACDFHGNIRAKWGTAFTVTPEMRAEMAKKGVNLPEDYVGRTALSFTVVDKRARTSTPSASQATAGEGASA